MFKKSYIKYIARPLAILANSFKIGSIQFFISFSIMIITITFMMIIGLMLYDKFNKTAEQNAVISTRQVMDQVNLNLDYYLMSMMEISDSIKALIGYKEDIDEKKILEQMNVILDTRKDIVSLNIFSNSGQMVVGLPLYKMKRNAGIVNQNWFRGPVNEPANLYFSSPHVQNIFEGQHNWVVSLSRQISYYRSGQKVQGILLVDMNFNTLDQLCQKAKLGKKGYIYLVDSQDNIVYHPKQELINAGLMTENLDEVIDHISGIYYDRFNGENRLITIQTVNYCRWRIVGVAYMDDIVTTKKEIGGFIGWTIIFGTLFVIFISVYLSSKISQPIKELERSMKKVEEGIFDIDINIKGETEVAHLSKTFDIMVTKIRYLMEQIVKEQEAKRKGELEVLQAQINPHFLYNTLNSVVRMVENGKNADAITMITSLSKLFRISISKGRNIITVQEEIEHASNYLIIQQIRYKNKFKFEVNVRDEILDCKIIKLLLQPILENSINHGIECMADEGMIKLTASEVNGRILLQIEDNGVGMEPAILKDILSARPESSGGSGVGVKNVHERIQLCYGREYGLEFESELDRGTTVRIWLPIVRD